MDIDATAKEAAGIAGGLLLMGFTINNYLWRLLITTDPRWGSISNSPGTHLFNLSIFVSGVFITYVSILNGVDRVVNAPE